MFTKLILAKKVKQGQLFVLPSNGKPDYTRGIYRRVFRDGYIDTMEGGHGPCIIGTNELSLTLCNQDNMVYVQK